MESIISKLLLESGYVKRNPTDPNACDAYINNELQDCIIVCEYDVENLASFTDSKKTKSVMNIFDKTRQHENIFKNTSLVIPLKLTKFDDYELIKNIVLGVEENPFAFRKYVALYTMEGVKNLSTSGNLKKKLEDILLDPSRFKSFEEENADDEFRTVLELFIKLPFMSIRGISSIELADFSSPLEQPENSTLKSIFMETAHIFEGTAGLSIEDQINLLIESDLVQKFAKDEEKNHEV
jgi:hypothetical protein